MEGQEILERFIILCISLCILFYVINKDRIIRLHPLLALISICTFFMCFVFTRGDYGVGIGFGLFAVFSILRFRTETFSIQTIVFLFASITLSLLDALLPIENLEILLAINIAITLVYLYLNYLEKKSPVTTQKNSLELIIPLEFLDMNEDERKQHLTQKIKLKKFSYNIKMINLIENNIILKITY